MFLNGIIETTVISILALTGATILLRSRGRSATDVAIDLDQAPLLLNGPHAPDLAGHEEQGLSWSRRFTLNDQLGSAGLYERRERARYLKLKALTPLYGAVGMVALHLAFIKGSFVGTLAFGLIGFLGGFVFERIKFNRRREKHKGELIYFLPIVMERIVMAAQSGLDVYSAISRVVELEQKDRPVGSMVKLDPITKLLEIVKELTESGLGFESALQEVAGQIDCSPLRHAFMHLGLAHQEGGEMVKPLTELSDATQLYYQESIEEEIAQLPVRATLPLLCTFAGLIIGFLTSPLLQILKFTTKAVPH